MSSQKSLAYIDILDDGNIYIEAGNSSTPVTNIGKNTSGRFQPYVAKSNGMTIIHPYLILSEYIPARFKNITEFLYAFEQQSPNNEYIHNYINLASEQIYAYLRSNGVIDDNTLFISVNKDSRVSETFLNYLTSQSPKRAIKDVVFLKDGFDEGDLSVDDSAPKDIKNKLEDLLNQVDRVDRTYSFEDLDLDPEMMTYINGFVSINEEKLNKYPKSSTIILVNDFFSNRSILLETQRKLNSLGYTVLFSIVLARKK